MTDRWFINSNGKMERHLAGHWIEHDEYEILLTEGRLKDAVVEAARSVIDKDGMLESDFIRLERMLADLDQVGLDQDG